MSEWRGMNQRLSGDPHYDRPHRWVQEDATETFCRDCGAIRHDDKHDPLEERIATLEAALWNCGMAAHSGLLMMATKRAGGREKLAYIERQASAVLTGDTYAIAAGARPSPEPLTVALEFVLRAVHPVGGKFVDMPASNVEAVCNVVRAALATPEGTEPPLASPDKGEPRP